MADLKRVRKNFAIAAAVLAVVTVLGIAYIFFPMGASNAELNDELKQTNKELELKEAQAKPLRGLPEKLVKTNEDILKFYRQRLPLRQSDISEEMGKLATKDSIALSDVKYEDFDTDIPDVRAVVVQAQLSGQYEKLAHFINDIERDQKTFMIVDGLTLNDQKGGTVQLQLHFETYLRPAFTTLAAEEKPAEVKLPSSTARSKARAKR